MLRDTTIRNCLRCHSSVSFQISVFREPHASCALRDLRVIGPTQATKDLVSGKLEILYRHFTEMSIERINKSDASPQAGAASFSSRGNSGLVIGDCPTFIRRWRLPVRLESRPQPGETTAHELFSLVLH